MMPSLRTLASRGGSAISSRNKEKTKQKKTKKAADKAYKAVMEHSKKISKISPSNGYKQQNHQETMMSIHTPILDWCLSMNIGMRALESYT